MIVTINTDASFNARHKFGTFAFWIVSNKFKILKSGILKGNIGTVHEAEMKSILNALHVLFNEDLKQVSKIVINTDCLGAISGLEKGSYTSPICPINFKTYVDKGIKIVFKHVKAHTDKGDARSYVNDWCDREAKRMMNIKISQIAA